MLKSCVYCGTHENLTHDHVPPKLFFAAPYPNNLVTVPACYRCNSSFQANDEYTRYVATTDMRSSKNPGARSKMPAIVRSLQRPAAKAFVHYLRSQTEYTKLLNFIGKPMGTSFEVDRNRVNATGERIIRAFSFVDTGNVILSTTPVHIGCGVGVAPTGR